MTLSGSGSAPVRSSSGLSEEYQALERVITERHTCRKFLRIPVPSPLIEQILEVSQRAPSWCNSQPWQVVLTSGAATDRFRDAYFEHASRTPIAPDLAFPKEYKGRYLERRRETGWLLYDSVGVKRGDREGSRLQGLENYRFFEAPHVAIVTTDRALGIYGAIDCGVYAAHFVLVAQSLGIATAVQAALATHPDFVRRHLGLSDDRMVVCGISFGYADVDHLVNEFRTTRAPLVEIVTHLTG